MSDASTPNQAAASPYSTGGGGARLEHRYGALFLTRLLTQKSVAELDEQVPTCVSFQQSPATAADDLVITAQADDSRPSVRLEIAVRRTPKFIKSHDATKQLVAALVEADINAEQATDPQLEIRLAVAVSGRQEHAREMAALGVVARTQASASEFFALVNTPNKFAARRRLGHLRDMVAEALSTIDDPKVGTAEHRCWSLLGRLRIIQLDLEAGHDADWTALVDDLRSSVPEQSHDAAVALRDRLEQLSAEFAQNAGVIDGKLLRRRLNAAIDLDGRVPLPGWARLRTLDREARAVVSRTLVGSDGEPALRLPREAVRDALRAAISLPGDLIVKGDSGVGKSALVMDAVELSEQRDDHQAVALNLRHLSRSQLGLLSQLLNPLDELFGELSAPVRLLVIDSAEATAEDHGQVFSYVLRCARDAGLKVIVIAATEGAGVATDLMRSDATAPREHVVTGLTDEEVMAAASHFPRLQRLADNARARELLRRPIVVDLLGRAENPGLPLSESEALDHIWRDLVRNGDRQNAGAPDAREQVMLRLAAHALRKGDTGELLARLDPTAVEGLRRSGLILPASRLPWERAPEFKHDLLRAYSIARYLLEERDPVSTLLAVGAPRWSLPSARLACEILLSAPDVSSHRRTGRFARLQTRFEEIVTAGHGERWADVPTEALVAVPESQPLVVDAWPVLMERQGHGLTRTIRILHGRHQPDGLLDPIVAEPFVSQLVNEVSQLRLDDVAELIRDWLRTQVLRGTPAGQPTRVALREAILAQCAANERALDEHDAAAEAARASRTPQQIAAEEEHRRKFATLEGSMSSGRRRRPEPTRRRPYLWISDSQIEHLALLGFDLAADGEAILRRIAEDDPGSLDHAVESLLVGTSLAAYDPKLLVDLAAAYYIEDDDEDEFGWSGGLDRDGIRRHRFGGVGTRLSSFTHGPFLAMFRADYRGGVGFLNRMLNHATRCRVRDLASFRRSAVGEEDEFQYAFSVTGESRVYVGDPQVWLWYRGTGVGPYPCMSALQALEFVTDEFVRVGIPVTNLLPVLLDGAESIAMPALALGIAVRHLEAAGDAIDPYLVDTSIWSLEFARVVHDQTGFLAAQTPGLENTDRRTWSLREVSTMLVLRAEGGRIEALKDLGAQLLANARAELDDDSSPTAKERLATVQNWADSLDRGAYDLVSENGKILVQRVVNPEVEKVLGETNLELQRANDAAGLTVRHARGRDRGSRAPDLTSQELADDIATARDLSEAPPGFGFGTGLDGPIAVAASGVELHMAGAAHLTSDDLQWCGTVLLRVAAEVAEHPSDVFDDSLFSQGADRSAARALPYFLLPAASELREALGVTSSEEIQELVELSAAVAVHAPNETRLAYAQALDVVWDAPCDESYLHGLCHHRIALELVHETFVDCVLGPWDNEAQRQTIVALDPPTASSLDVVEDKRILLRRLAPAIRATASAALRPICCQEDARQCSESLVAAHQRAMLVREHGYLHSDSDSLIAARAMLWQALDGRDDPVLVYVDRYLCDSKALAEALKAISVAGEERAEAGEQARRLWPRIMDRVMDAVEANPRLFTEHTWGDYAEASLIPNPLAGWGYLTIELADEPIAWPDLLSWSGQVERWLGMITGARMSIDQLVIAVRALDVPDQVGMGLMWIERAVERGSNNCVGTYTLPEWLRERRADLTTGECSERWRRIVDLLVVAGDGRVADLAD